MERKKNSGRHLKQKVTARYKILSRLADLRLKIYGKDRVEVFENAALVLAKILFEKAEEKQKFCRGFEKISVTAQNQNTLMVIFLNQILSLSRINRKVYPRIKILKISPTGLEAQVSGFGVPAFSKNIKAINYHGEEIREEKENLEIVLTFSV